MNNGDAPIGSKPQGRAPCETATTVATRTPRRAAAAKTCSGCPCKGPAMTNGRCRMHGGASTGPSADGRARIAAARTKDGFYTKAMKASTEGVAMFVRRMRVVRTMSRMGFVPRDLAPALQDLPMSPMAAR